MPDTRDPQSVITAAEQAAVGGDYASAERLLREAAELQEASLGPMHPELANTLNNLGVVYEVTEKPDEAERCFRRASEIATAVLPPDHPFVATSRQNLDDFLKTRVKPADAPIPPLIPPPAASTPPRPAVTRAAESDHTEPVEAAPQPSTWKEPPPVPARTSALAITIGLVLAAVLLAAFLATRLWSRGDRAPQSTPATVSAPATAPAERSTEELQKPAPPAPAPVEPAHSAAPKAASTSEPGRTDRTKSAAIAKPPPLVADVQLCRDLETGGPASGKWKCNPPSQPVTAGRLVFYTRVKSPTDATVQHRWYRGDRLRKSVDLAIRANPGDGYRTFSRNTVVSGEWRVELRTRDGVLLHEERFTVR